MDTTLWILAITAHIAILGLLLYRGIYLPIFTATILAGLAESQLLYLVLHHGTAREYFLAYYICDLLNIGLYCATINECRRSPRFYLISFSMSVYLGSKVAVYALLAAHLPNYASHVQNGLRMMNLACLFAWLSLLAMYSEQAPPSRTYGGFMETEQEPIAQEPDTEQAPATEETAAKPTGVDPGAPAPEYPQH